MCESRYFRVLKCTGDSLEVEDLYGTRQRVSLLAFEGDRPRPGDWVVAHSGFALVNAPLSEIEATIAELSALTDVNKEEQR